MTTEDSKKRMARRKRSKDGNTVVLPNVPIPDLEAWIALLEGRDMFPPGVKERNRDTISTATASLIADNCREMRKLINGRRPESGISRAGSLRREGQLAQPSEPRLVKRSKHTPPRPESPNVELAKLESLWEVNREIEGLPDDQNYDWDRAVDETDLDYLDDQ